MFSILFIYYPFPKRHYILLFLKTMIINTNLYRSMFTSFFHFCYCYMMKYNCLYFFIALLYVILIVLVSFLICPYFRGNSLNSRAGLELKEIRLFPRLLKKQKIKFKVLLETSSWKKQGFFSWISAFFLTIIVEKGRTSLNSRPALEFKELPRK